MNAQTLAFWALALLTPWIVQVIKVKLVWSGPKAKWLAMGISFVIAALAKTIAGELSLPNLQADPCGRHFGDSFTLRGHLHAGDRTLHFIVRKVGS